jgi:hypothetical protein
MCELYNPSAGKPVLPVKSSIDEHNVHLTVRTTTIIHRPKQSRKSHTKSPQNKITHPNHTQRDAAHTTRVATISRPRPAASCDIRAREGAVAPSGRRHGWGPSRIPLRTPPHAARRSSPGSAAPTAQSTGAVARLARASLRRRSGSRSGRRCRPAIVVAGWRGKVKGVVGFRKKQIHQDGWAS